MRRPIVTGFVGLIVAMSLAAAVHRAQMPVLANNGHPSDRPMGKLIVHEWGTFTGFAGSDGVHLPFNTIVGSDLPEFVSNREKYATRLNPDLKFASLFVKAAGASALQRMETPVIYFYADAPGNVNVRVDFSHGLLTEFYPPVRDMGPQYGDAIGEFKAAAPASPAAASPGPQTRPSESSLSAASFLDWGDVRIIPHPTRDEGRLIPAVTDKTHYAFARNTDAATVQFTDVDKTRHEEKFLFYRGLGNFSLPVTLMAKGNDQFELRNAGPTPVSTAFLVEIGGKDHQSTRFARYENMSGNQQMTLPAAKSTQADLTDEIRKSLVASGLFEKEATAMIETWKDNWLAEPGTRVLYIVPRSVTDGLLPLHVSPMPDETVRTLVGRIDVLTPELESSLWQMMLAAREDGNLSNGDTGKLEDLGRFLEPALQRVSKLTGDDCRMQLRWLRDSLRRTQSGRQRKATP